MDIEGVISKLVSDIDSSKEQVVLNRLNQLGIQIDWEFEKQRRFKQLMVVNDSIGENWIYDNGTLNGQRIVTFKHMTHSDYLPDENGVAAKIELTYF